MEYFKGIKKSHVFKVVLLPTALWLVFSCSPLKRYSEENYAWALPEIERFKVLNKQAAPENALLFLGSSSIRLWSTLAEDMALSSNSTGLW